MQRARSDTEKSDLPCSSPASPGVIGVSQSGIEGMLQLDQTSEQPEQVREPVQISQYVWINRILQRKSNGQPLGAPAHRSCHVVGSGRRVRAGQRPVAKQSFGSFNAMNFRGKPVHAFVGYLRLTFSVFRRGSK